MTQSVVLNLKDPTTLETGIAFTQGDYGEEAVLQILTKDDDTYITDALSASISFTRSDGYIVTGELTGGGGIYQYQFKGNELQSAGKAVAVVTLEFEGGRVSTGSFAFNVRYNPMFDRGIDAGPYIWELEKIVASAKSYVEYLETLIEQLKPGIGSTALTKADLVNGFDQVEAGIKALDAAAGKRLWDKFGDYILKNQIVNNLLATQPGNVLDAMQGKILADKFAQLNSELGVLKNTDTAATLDDVKRILTNEFNKLSLGHYSLLRLPFSASFSPFYGGSHAVFITRLLDKYGIAQFLCYQNSGVRLIYMSFNNGSWNDPMAK